MEIISRDMPIAKLRIIGMDVELIRRLSKHWIVIVSTNQPQRPNHEVTLTLFAK
jgi:hypothetical protein